MAPAGIDLETRRHGAGERTDPVMHFRARAFDAVHGLGIVGRRQHAGSHVDHAVLQGVDDQPHAAKSFSGSMRSKLLLPAARGVLFLCRFIHSLLLMNAVFCLLITVS